MQTQIELKRNSYQRNQSSSKRSQEFLKDPLEYRSLKSRVLQQQQESSGHAGALRESANSGSHTLVGRSMSPNQHAKRAMRPSEQGPNSFGGLISTKGASKGLATTKSSVAQQIKVYSPGPKKSSSLTRKEEAKQQTPSQQMYRSQTNLVNSLVQTKSASKKPVRTLALTKESSLKNRKSLQRLQTPEDMTQAKTKNNRQGNSSESPLRGKKSLQ